MTGTDRVEVTAFSWPEVEPGDDLTALIVNACQLVDGDIVVLTSKVVSKAEGQVVSIDRDVAVAEQTVRVVARRGKTVIAETPHGLVMAAGGVDASNVAPGSVVLLPSDPDATARSLRDALSDRTQANVAVVITDTAGRAWRMGQTDLAIGCAGLTVVIDHAGTTDPYGNILTVTAPAVADEIAGAADLVKQKTTGRPMAVVRGLAPWVRAPGDHGEGATSLLRPSSLDLFGLGARDAVIAAILRSDQAALAHFPPRVEHDAEPFSGVVSAHRQVRLSIRTSAVVGPPSWEVDVEVETGCSHDAWVQVGRLLEKLDALGAAYTLSRREVDQPATPAAGWQTVSSAHWFVA